MALLAIVLSGVVVVALLAVVGSFGHYTRRIEQSNAKTLRGVEQSNELNRKSNEKTRHEIDRARDDIADAIKLRRDMLSTCPHTERSA